MNAQKKDAGSVEKLEAANRMFESVWKRVATDAQVGPIALEDAQDEADFDASHCDCAPEPENAWGPARGVACPLPIMQTALPALPAQREPMEIAEEGAEDEEESHTDDFPPRSAVPFLGSGSASCADLLQEFIRRETQGRQLYRALAQRVMGAPARHFSSMAAENLRAAKRLSAACFLITGVQSKPRAMETVRLSSYLESLRERFIEEQQSAALYLSAAAEVRDPWLYRLFSDLAEQKLSNAQRICFLVEQL